MGGAGHLYTWVKVENGPRTKPCCRSRSLPLTLTDLWSGSERQRGVRKLTSEHEGEKTGGKHKRGLPRQPEFGMTINSQPSVRRVRRGVF